MIYEWKKIEISNRVDYDYCLLLEPTSPFRRTTDVCSLIGNTIKYRNKYDSSFTAAPVRKSQHPFKYFCIDKNSQMIYKYGSSKPSLPIANRHDCDSDLLVKDGSAYLISKNEAFNNRRLISTSSFVQVNHSFYVNIDNYEDVLLAQACEEMLEKLD